MDTPSFEPAMGSRPLQSTSGTTPVRARVALVGVHGFGTHHLHNLERLAADGMVELVAVADPNPPAAGGLPGTTAVHSTLDELLAADHRPDIIIVATPIQTHAPLALSVLASHADLYLEKPPVASMADFLRLQEAASATGRSVQVGFQSLGSHALAVLEQLAAGNSTADFPGIGTLKGISATGRWVRDRAYYKRSRWAGKRSLDGVDVVDGVATNPLAHAIATALRIAGAREPHDLASVETDLYRANDIEADDTSVIRLRTASGLPITCALTLCSAESVEPYITLQGTNGTAVFHYTEDRVAVTTEAGESSRVFGRDDLTGNLIEHLATGVPLISPLQHSGAFMRVVEAIRTAEPPQPISPDFVEWVGTGQQAHAVIPGIQDAVERATHAHATFAELGLPWARQATTNTEPLFANGPSDTVLRNGSGLESWLSPRPYLHPVSTPSGTVVTDHLPSDHVWHLGAGFALQDVNGSNFWGGRSYRRSAGKYVDLMDHGRIEIAAAARAADHTALDLDWFGSDGSLLLQERRTFERTALTVRTWRLDIRTRLTAVVDASLGSPGSHGAPGSGYGGFFWRLPANASPRVFSSTADGESAVHGSVSPWLAWAGEFDAGPATLVFAAPRESADPWFVRCGGYPAVGSALAWDESVELAAGETLTRTNSVWISDGLLDPREIEDLVTAGRDDALVRKTSCP
ncbi:putative dehydrogenase [Paenarthrobacter nicotinovorans]|uniref:Dehydrogenase n=1 Tax=Paenarthrobacter nicotinovorans TaxID=29320 RepID=A0ABT9TFV6_PAENI|nr:putative dehydrogenase [Paenarthrobacter nicotinovorans]GAT85425.1 oxidoreductase [Paenarthrobacter nicotinovorans]